MVVLVTDVVTLDWVVVDVRVEEDVVVLVSVWDLVVEDVVVLVLIRVRVCVFVVEETGGQPRCSSEQHQLFFKSDQASSQLPYAMLQLNHKIHVVVEVGPDGQPRCSSEQHQDFFMSDQATSQLLYATLQLNQKLKVVVEVVAVIVLAVLVLTVEVVVVVPQGSLQPSFRPTKA